MKFKVILNLFLSLVMITTPPLSLGATGDPLSEIRKSFLLTWQDPFNEKQVNDHYRAVVGKMETLKKTDEGKDILRKTFQLKKMNLIKKKLDRCFGSDILKNDLGQILLLAMKSVKDMDCDLHSWDSQINDIENALREGMLKPHGNLTPDQIRKMRQLNLNLFRDTASSAAQTWGTINQLIDLNGNGLDFKSKLSDSICEDTQCPDNLKASMNRAQFQTQKALESQGYKPKLIGEYSGELKRKWKGIYENLHGPHNNYHPRHLLTQGRFDPSRSKNFISGLNIDHKATANQYRTSIRVFGNDSRILNNPSFDPVTIYLPNSDTIPDIFERTRTQVQVVDQLNLQVIPEISTDVYGEIESLNRHPLGQVLGRGDGKMLRAFGHGMLPRFVRDTNSNYARLVLTDENESTYTLPDQMGKLDHDEIKDSLKTKMNAINDQLKEMAEDLYQDDLSTDDQVDQFLKLMVSNPKSAAKNLLRDPRLVGIYCKAFLEKKNDEFWEDLTEWALLGITIGTAIFTFGASLGASAAVTAGRLVLGQGLASAGRVGGQALIASAVADTVYAGYSAYSDFELSDLHRMSCYSQENNERSCEEFKKSYRDAIFAVGVAGLSLPGAGALLKVIGRYSNKSLKQFAGHTSRVREFSSQLARSQNGRRLTEQLTDEELGIFLGEMTLTESDQFLKSLKRMNQRQVDDLVRKVKEMVRTCPI